ncbi:gastrin/cholecystokinin-like peptide [Rhinatrema bivittatum]|uniref:gastrin/cholecystokinin-like peptide n=1 Tax=Rhinatrema bivittatum TaxID=194408 RepID=UPI0011266DC1|nr:gastrin/cholecystokinin-like peptide [Rhinatrema bivittatum]
MTRTVWLGFLIALLAGAGLSRPMGGVHKPDTASAQSQASRSLSSEPARRDLLGSLSQDQMLFMSRFLPEIYAELSNKDGYWHENGVHPMHDRDYAGWMDFGRRSVEDTASDA